MSALRWHRRPKLRRPVLVAAFEGWNDAGDAASSAARWLADRHDAEHVATIEAEDFFDFTTTRPMVSTGPDGTRHLTWPDTELWAAPTAAGSDLVVLVGHEPHLRWRTYCAAVLEAAEALDASLVLTLGALLSDVPHSRPTAVSGTADDPELIERLHLVRSGYEGPTGIVGVLHATCSQAGRPSASLWASVPTYVSGAPSPKATLALVERAMAVLGLSLPTTDLEIASAAYERQIDELVADDDDTAAYVHGLEEAADDQPSTEADDDLDALADSDPAELVEEVERFLRGD
ncbi:MAG: PAC2 family protein [Actinobacteria bacterium]|nr:PAC2 family protein [Actinomycetota bacterium]